MDIENLQEQLNDIQGARDDIQSTLESKGVSVSNDIRTYATAVDNLGNINTVNGIGVDENRNAQIDASNINVDDTAEITQTIKSAIEEMNTEIAERLTKTEAEPFINDVSFDNTTFTFTFKNYKGETQTFDLPLESTVKSGRYDDTTKALILVLQSDDEVSIPVNELCDVYTGIDGAKVKVTVNSNNEIEATIKEGTITKTDLIQELQEEITNKVDNETFNNLDTQVKELETEVEGKATTEQLSNSINTLSTEVENKASIDYVDEKTSDIAIPYLVRGIFPTVSIATAGTGYSVGEIVKISFEDEIYGNSIAMYLTVVGVDDTGAVTTVIPYVGTTFTFTYGKAYKDLEATYVNNFSGSGSGLTISLLANPLANTYWTLDGFKLLGDLKVIEKGTGYVINDFIYITTVGKGFAAQVTEVDENGGIISVSIYRHNTRGSFSYPLSIKQRNYTEEVLTTGGGAGAVVEYIHKTQSISTTIGDIYSYLPDDSSNMVTYDMFYELEDEVTTLSNTKADKSSIETINTNITNLTTTVDSKADSTRVDTIETNLETLSTEVENKASIDELDAKQNTLVSGTNIKTVNGETILGSGDLVIEDNTIFHWDGNGSDTDPNSIIFWQKVVDASMLRDVYITVVDTVDVKGPRLLCIKQGDITDDTKVYSPRGILYDIYSDVDEDEGCYIGLNFATAYLRLSQKVVTYVEQGVGAGSISTYKEATFLPTKGTNVTGYVPTYDYHPATKKYVDEVVSSLPTSDTENYIYSWDGQSSDTNPDNIALWQTIIDRALGGETVLVTTHGDGLHFHYVFVVGPRCVDNPNDTSTIFKSLVSENNTTTTSSGGVVTKKDFQSKFGQVSVLHEQNYVVTKVNVVTSMTRDLSGYLPTHNQDITDWTPTYDYHPATKKYVDDAIVSYIDSLNASEVSY